jgi:hypothetical protein
MDGAAGDGARTRNFNLGKLRIACSLTSGVEASVDENLTAGDNLWLFGRVQSLSSKRSHSPCVPMLRAVGNRGSRVAARALDGQGLG